MEINHSNVNYYVIVRYSDMT